MTTHHACEPVWQIRDTPCPYCATGSTPIQWVHGSDVFATVECRNTPAAIIRGIMLNMRQVNTAYRWHRYGATLELD